MALLILCKVKALLVFGISFLDTSILALNSPVPVVLVVFLTLGTMKE
jgi:hypothetical protein